jgi:TP901 family phage tail tape measure protein
MTSVTSKLDFVLRLVDRVSQPLGNITSRFADLGQRGQRGIQQMGAGLAGVVGVGYALQQAMAPALEQQRALGEVKSLGVAGDALDLLNKKSLRFSVAYGENATAFVKSAYDIQSAIAGLTGTQLAAFTNASNVLAKATKADAATITNYVGTMYGIFKTQADAMGKAEWVEQLAGTTALAVQMFKTTGAQMSAAFTGVGANATAAGVGLAEQVAILGTLQATMSGGEAGTKYKAFLSGVGNAQTQLGLKFTDSQGRLLPMLDILDKLKVKFGDTLTVADSDVLKKAFGSDEAVGLIKLLMNDTAGLANSMDQLGKVKGMEKANKMAMAMVDPWQRVGSAVTALRIGFGQLLLPVLNPLLDRLADGTAIFQRWIDLFPNLGRWLGYITLGVLGLIAAASLLTVVVGLFSVLSILASPIVLIALGLIALVVAVGAAIFWWDKLKAAFGETAWFQALLVFITPVVLLIKIFWAVLQFTWRAVTQLVAIGAQFLGWLGGLLGITGQVSKGWDSLLLIFAQLSPFNLLGKALGAIIDLLNLIPGVEIDTSFADLPALPKVPGGEVSMSAIEQASAAQKAQQTINAAIPSLSPNRASAVPPGGLLTNIQNSSTQNKGPHIEKFEYNTTKPMTAHDLQGLLELAG